MKKLVGLVSIKGKTAEEVHEELLKVLDSQKEPETEVYFMPTYKPKDKKSKQ